MRQWLVFAVVISSVATPIARLGSSRSLPQVRVSPPVGVYEAFDRRWDLAGRGPAPARRSLAYQAHRGPGVPPNCFIPEHGDEVCGLVNGSSP